MVLQVGAELTAFWELAISTVYTPGSVLIVLYAFSLYQSTFTDLRPIIQLPPLSDEKNRVRLNLPMVMQLQVVRT